MPGPNLSQSLVSGSANYTASDWGSFSASGKLNLLASAELRRGINLGLGAEALVELTGSVSKFLAVDLDAQANAAARVQAQVQVPLDLFGEAGLAIRLQAVAEAAVGISLGVGLSVGDFLALAGSDPRMQGAPLKLLELLLEPNQVVISAGMKAKAAASAMAYANFLANGSLVGNQPGFVVAAEAGLGLKAGAGYQVFANFGLNSPHRFIRRSVEIAVDETIRGISARLDVAQQGLASELKLPAKIAFRTAFELGLALAENGGAFNANAGPQLAQRLCIVILEEGQRFILETLTSFAIDAFQERLRQAGISQSTWNNSQSRRSQLADKLRAMPDDPFDPTPDNRTYWTGVITDITQLSTQLLSANAADGDKFAAILWSAIQLLFRQTEVISSAQVRANVVGVGAHTRSAAFNQPLAQQPLTAVRRVINTSLGRGATATLSEANLVEFLITDAVLTPLVQRTPALLRILNDVFGPSAGGGIAAARVILREAGAFVPAPGGGAPNSEATLRALLNGLQAFVDNRLQNDVIPAVRETLGDNDALNLYLEEVLLPPLHYSLRILSEQVLTWNQNGAVDQKVLREACSGVLLKLISRSLIVSLDVLMNACLSSIQQEFTSAASHVNDNNGIAQKLARATTLDRAFVAELLEETLLISADTFGPLSSERRARIRSLLFQVADVLPGNSTDDFLVALRDDFFVPNLEAAVDLAMVSGELIAENLEKFVAALLNRVCLRILEELIELLEEIQATVGKWINDLENLVQELADEIAECLEKIEQFGEDLENAWNNAFNGVQDMVSQIANTGRSDVRAKVKRKLVAKAVDVLEDNDIYKAVPGFAKRKAKDALEDAIGGLLNNELFDDVWEAVASISSDTAELMEELRDLDPDRNLTNQIKNKVINRIEDSVFDLFGGDNPRIGISFTFSFNTFFGRISKSVNLGNVTFRLDKLIEAVGEGLDELGFIEDDARRIGGYIEDWWEAAANLAQAEEDKESAEEEKKQPETRLAAAKDFKDVGVEVLSPAAGGFYETPTVEIEIFLKHVPFSFLGLGELEEERVHIFLNNDELEMNAFTVDEYEPTEGPQLDQPARGFTVAVSGTHVDKDSSPAKATAAAPVLRYQPGAPVGPWGETFFLEPKQAADPKERQRLFRAQQGKPTTPRVGKREQALFASRGLASRQTKISVDSVRIVARSAGLLRVDVAGKKTSNGSNRGRQPSVIGRESHMPQDKGLMLKIILPASRFVEGPNTLTVALTPNGKDRVSQVVSFIVFPPDEKVGGKRPPTTVVTKDAWPSKSGLETLVGFGGKPKTERTESDRKPTKVSGVLTATKKQRADAIQKVRKNRQARSKKTADGVTDQIKLVRARLTKPATRPI